MYQILIKYYKKYVRHVGRRREGVRECAEAILKLKNAWAFSKTDERHQPKMLREPTAT